MVMGWLSAAAAAAEFESVKYDSSKIRLEVRVNSV